MLWMWPTGQDGQCPCHWERWQRAPHTCHVPHLSPQGILRGLVLHTHGEEVTQVLWGQSRLCQPSLCMFSLTHTHAQCPTDWWPNELWGTGCPAGSSPSQGGSLGLREKPTGLAGFL